MKSYHDIAGDGGSNVLGQVEARQHAVRTALAGVRHVIAVGSGKGGVGKSTVALALARAFRELSGPTGDALRVAVLDADLNGPCQARMAGLEGVPLVPLAGAGRLSMPRRPDGIGVVSLGSVLPGGDPLTFETVSTGEEQTWRATRELALLLQLLGAVEWGELDLLLVDLPPGAERTVQFADLLAPLVQPAEPAERLGFVMVSVPSDVSRGVVARSLTALAARSGRGGTLLGCVENMAGYFCRDCGEVRPLFPEPTTVLNAPCLGRLPFDPALAELCDRGWPAGSEVERTSAAFAAAREIAANLADRLFAPAPQRDMKRPSSASAEEALR
jgi:ATP-binding protein involved in chromosome partitioning